MEFNDIDDFLNDQSFVNFSLGVNDSDIAFWINYKADHPEQILLIEEASLLIKETKWLILAERYKPQAVEALKQYLNNSSIKPAPSYWFYAASAAAILLFLSFLFNFYSSNHKSKSILTTTYEKHIFQYRQLNERKAIRLWDSSVVILEKGSSLTIDPSFGKTNRKMWLSGTAYFKVHKDKIHPFKVITGTYATTAVGTAFKLQADNASNKLKIELEEGRVRVEKRTSSKWQLLTYLNPLEKIAYGYSSAIPDKKVFDRKQLQRWKTQEIVFQDAPIKDVISQLEIYYNVTISVNANFANNEVFTGRFKNDNLPAVIQVLCFTLGKQYKFNDKNEIEIY